MARRSIQLPTHAGFFAAIGALLAAASPAAADPLDRPVQDEVIYQIMPITYRDSDNDTRSGKPAHFGDFNGLTASLDYFQYLGITALYLQPIFPSPAYHGYQHNAADTLNSWFGSQADFQNLVNQAHARGVKIYLDFVAYGISTGSTYFTSAYNHPTSTYDTWLAFTNSANTQYTGYSYSTWNGSNVGFINWNLGTAAAANQVTSWALKWLDPNADGDTADGVDGYRLDHAYSNSPEGWGATISFWQNFCTAIRTKKPGAFVFCEPGDWGNYGTDLLTSTGFDGVATKPFEFAARDALANGIASGLYDSLAATLAAIPAGKTVVAQINDHDSDRLASVLGGSFARHKAAAAVLLTQPFPPNIYYGDEIGMRGTKGSFGSDADDIPNREPFKWNAVAGPPMSNYFVLNTGAYNARVEQNNDGRSVQEQQGVSGSLLEAYKALIAARKASPALRRGSYVPIAAASPYAWVFVRQDPGQTVLVAINVSSRVLNLACNLSAFGVAAGSTTPHDLLSGASSAPITSANRQTYPLSLGAYEYRVLEVGLTAPIAPGPIPANIDGRSIPADFGPAALRATQATPTSMGDNTGELDQLFVRPAQDGLRIGITGNLPTDGSGLIVWIDSGTGGSPTQVTFPLSSPPAFVPPLAGTVFDAGFTPGHALVINAPGSTFYVDHIMSDASGALKFYRGKGTLTSGSGLLTAGSNATGLAVAIDNTNTQGITASSAAPAATATKGVEMLIPYGDIGLPLAPVARAGLPLKISVAITGPDGAFANQFLPSVPAGAGDAGLAPNLAALAGDQFVSITLPHAGEFNGDGQVSVQDLFDFLAAWFGQARGSDFNGDASVSVQDLFDFIAAWFAG